MGRKDVVKDSSEADAEMEAVVYHRALEAGRLVQEFLREAVTHSDNVDQETRYLVGSGILVKLTSDGDSRDTIVSTLYIEVQVSFILR